LANEINKDQHNLSLNSKFKIKYNKKKFINYIYY